MTFEAIITLTVIALAILLFITEWVAVDIVAIGIMVLLVSFGVIDAQESIEGFANDATLTVAAMFILSSALIKSNILEKVGPIMTNVLKRGYAYSIGVLGLIVGSLSAFINNTPVVATFIPIISESSKKVNIPPSRFLMPLSFIAMLGGTCTLIGTSTNLLVSGISESQGYGSFSMFLLAPLGLIMGLVGTIYLILFGKKLIPERSEMNQRRGSDTVDQYLTEIRLSDSTSKKYSISSLFKEVDLNVSVLSLRRNDKIIKKPDKKMLLSNEDVLLISCSIKQIERILKSKEIQVVSSKEESQKENQKRLLEIVLLSKSELDRKKLSEINFEKKNNLKVVGVRRKGRSLIQRISDIELRSGDLLLVEASNETYDQLKEQLNSRESNFLLLNEAQIGQVKKKQLYLTVATILFVVLLASTKLIPIVIAAFGGVVVLNLTRVISMEEAYKAVDWQVIFLLAGALSLEKAMRKSGLDDLISDFLVYHAGELYGPIAVLSTFYLLSTLITGIISNNAAAALLAPISISIAESMQISPIPFLIAITFAASASFFTPVGYQTNTMVYSAGSYKFRDFLIVGAPLNIILWVLATILIPWIYPF